MSEGITICAEVLPVRLAERSWGDRGRPASAASGEESKGRRRGFTNGHVQQYDPDAEVHNPLQGTANVLLFCYLRAAPFACDLHA